MHPTVEEVRGRGPFATHHQAGGISLKNLPVHIGDAYQTLAAAPEYRHFARIPDRIIQCIDYFGIECDRLMTRERLQAYYLFIGVVDDAIDSGQIDTGGMILDYLSTPVLLFDGTVDGRECD